LEDLVLVQQLLGKMVWFMIFRTLNQNGLM